MRTTDRRRRTRRAAGIATLGLALAAATGGCGGGEDGAEQADAATEPKPAKTRDNSARAELLPGAPVLVQRTEDDGVQMYVDVRIRKKNFMFLVDTGATQTIVDVAAAKKAGLSLKGSRRTFLTLAGENNVRLARIRDWAIPGTRLGKRTVVVDSTQLRGYKINGRQIGGFLGADVLSEYGGVTFDFIDNRLVLGGKSPRRGKHVRAEIARFQGQTTVGVRTKVRGERQLFILDTGASNSTIDEPLARDLGLRFKGKRNEIGTIAKNTTVRPVVIDRWSTGRVKLPKVLASATGEAARQSNEGFAGLLGAEVLESFGRARVDFRRKQLILGF